MATRTFRRIVGLALGLLVALGMSLSVVQASAMAAGMTMSMPQIAASGMDDCSGCKDMPTGTKSMTCDAACTAVTVAVMPQFTALVIRSTVDRPLIQSPVLSGWTASPNPHPPKHVALV